MVSLKAMIDESRNHLFTAAGYRPDIFRRAAPEVVLVAEGIWRA